MRVAGRVLLGVGVFALVLVPFLRFYAYPRLAVEPPDESLKVVATAHDANVLNPKTLTNIQTDLTTTRTLEGDVKAADQQGHHTVVWVMTVSTVDSQNQVLSRFIERAALNDKTAEAVNCCGQYLSTAQGVDQPVHHHGLVFTFPINTQKKTYLFWDPTLEKATPMLYTGSQTLDGYTVYKFVQTIKPTPTGSPQKLNAAFLDLPGTKDIESQQYYSNIRTVWVEPNTGAILKGQEKQYNSIRAEGRDRVITTAATVTYTPKTVAMLAHKYGPKGTELHLVHTLLPIILLIVGAVVVVAGIILLLLDARRRRVTPSSA